MVRLHRPTPATWELLTPSFEAEKASADFLEVLNLSIDSGLGSQAEEQLSRLPIAP